MLASGLFSLLFSFNPTKQRRPAQAVTSNPVLGALDSKPGGTSLEPACSQSVSKIRFPQCQALYGEAVTSETMQQ